MKKNCIRGLKKFDKGCPEHNMEGGCQAWIEMSVATKGNPKVTEIKKQCLDLWTFEFQWAMLGGLEGNQQASEATRNMVALTALTMAGKKPQSELERVSMKHLSPKELTE